MRLFFGIVLFVIVALNVHSQTSNGSTEAIADSILSLRGEVFFSCSLPDTIPVYSISNIISIDKVNGRKVWAYANMKEFAAFRLLNINYTIEQLKGSTFRSKAENRSFSSWNHYLTYEQYDSLMHHFNEAYPQFCLLENLGYSVKGRAIYAVKLGNHAQIHEDKPEIMFSGCMHGDELVSYLLMVHLIDYLLVNYNSPEVKQLMDTAEIWICPLANPDGTYFGGNNNVMSSTRYNANNIDLNRNYPDPAGGDHPDNNEWQPETNAMMLFLNKHNFSLSANFHSGAEVVNYPWDTWPQKHADDDWYQSLSRAYADSVHKYSPTNFFRDENSGITKGYNWYSIQGGRQDYVNYFMHGREVTIELESVKLAVESDLTTYWNYHYRSLINYLKAINHGFRGRITDSKTGTPLRASISIVNHENDNSNIFSDSITGMYYRMLSPGIYSLTIKASGFKQKIIPDMLLNAESQVTADVQLESENKIIIPDSTHNSWDYLYPNPALSNVNIHLFKYQNTTVSITITTLSGQVVYSGNYFNTGEDISLNTGNLSAGIYILKIKTSGKTINLKFFKL